MSESTLTTVDVKGIAYGLETHDWGFRVVKPKTGEVYDIVSCDDPVESNRFGWSCTCPDHAVRHAGVPTNGCKHFQAIQSAGLIDPPVTPLVPVPAPSVVVAVPAKPKSKPKSRSRKETVEEKRIRLRQEARAGVREYPDEYRDELRSARERLAEKRANRLNQIRSNWGEHVAKVLDGDREFRRHYIENNWDDIKAVRRQWLALPENVQRLREQRERQPIKHRLKFSLFGFQTPNERPYSGIEPTLIIHEQPTTPEDFRELAYQLEAARDRATSQADYGALYAEYRRAFETALDMEDAAELARIEATYPVDADSLIDLSTSVLIVAESAEPPWTMQATTVLSPEVSEGFSDGFYNADCEPCEITSRRDRIMVYLNSYATGQDLWQALATTIGDAPTDPTPTPDDSPERPVGDPGSILDVTTPNGFLGSLPPVSGASVDHAEFPSSPVIEQILVTCLPEFRGNIRQQPRVERSKAIRKLFKDLGLKSIKVTTPNYSMAHTTDVQIPEDEHNHAPGVEYATCPRCERRRQAIKRLEQIILAAFPDLDDRSDLQSSYHNHAFSVD